MRHGAALQPHQLDAVEHDPALVCGPAQIGQAEPRVVRLRVGIEPGGAQAFEPQRRHEAGRGCRRDHPPAFGDRAGQTGVRPERAANRDPAVRPAAVDGQDEVERPDEVRRDDAAQRMHLGEGFADEAEVAEAQVAKAAVDELRGRARRARCEVVALDERDPEAVPGRQRGDPGPDDPPADDEEVEPLASQALECKRALVVHRPSLTLLHIDTIATIDNRAARGLGSHC